MSTARYVIKDARTPALSIVFAAVFAAIGFGAGDAVRLL
jgi:hypothetical protein